MTHIPRSGPLCIDASAVSPALAVERVRTLVRRLRRPTPRELEILVDTPAVIRELVSWARTHAAPCTLQGNVLHVFLMPIDFGEPPRATLDELARLRQPIEETGFGWSMETTATG